jgi:TolA-binding protein
MKAYRLPAWVPPSVAATTLPALVTALALLVPAGAVAQKREDILSIQRDVAQMQDQLKQMQTGQEQKMATLESLLKQALEESGKTSAAMNALQREIAERLNEQQSKLVAPIAVLGTKVDQSADELRSLRENVADMSTRLGNLDNKLADISSAVRTLSQPPVAPPPAAGSGGGTILPLAGAAQVAPPGVSAESLWQNAFRDYSSGKDELAMMEFNDYLKYFPQTENAASAQYYVGQIYDRAKQYDDAVQAFDAVLERYPDNPKTPDAMYYKAVDLMKGGHRTDAAMVLKAFLARFPTHSLARNAQAHLHELGVSTAPAAPRPRKKQP